MIANESNARYTLEIETSHDGDYRVWGHYETAGQIAETMIVNESNADWYGRRRRITDAGGVEYVCDSARTGAWELISAEEYWSVPEVDPADADLIRRAIAASGLSARQFAAEIMVRDERTIRRWVKGEQAIPEVARRKLEALLATGAAPS